MYMGPHPSYVSIRTIAMHMHLHLVLVNDWFCLDRLRTEPHALARAGYLHSWLRTSNGGNIHPHVM